MIHTALVVAAVLAVLIAAVFVRAALRPDVFRMERSARIAAAPEKVFMLVNDLRAWSRWSPWEKKDPGMKKTHSGATQGKGAIYEWDGNKQIGSGRMEITESSPYGRIAIKLDFIKPFEGHNVAEFTLKPDGGGTELTWAMFGPTPYLMKVMHTVLPVERMIAKDFDAGLAELKAAAEGTSFGPK